MKVLMKVSLDPNIVPIKRFMPTLCYTVMNPPEDRLIRLVRVLIVLSFALVAAPCGATPLKAADQLNCIASDEKTGMVFIPGGSFTMGSNRERPEERFTHIVQVDGFWIDQHEVTNAEFDKFVKATGYITLAERGVDPKTHPGMSQDMLAPGSVIFIPPTELSRGGDLTHGGNM